MPKTPASPQFSRFVSRIFKLREKKGLTQRQMAQMLDVDVSTIRNWEKSRGGVQMFVRVAQLCELFECQPANLFEKE
ncbi:MAG: helix-turn-helix transcriptional regulator [Cyanobacteriota bacterium]|nr:helix-turn-helix transcriptional regulator [Cyanobacteriota bacterium]